MMTIRFLAAVGFVVFCITGAMTWWISPGVEPWWLPFAAVGAVWFVVSGAILIVSGPKVFREP